MTNLVVKWTLKFANIHQVVHVRALLEYYSIVKKQTKKTLHNKNWKILISEYNKYTR